MGRTTADEVQDLVSKGFKPCPNCGAYYNPAEPNVKDWHCGNCGADLSLSPEEAAKARLSDEELSSLIQAQYKKARTMKVLAIVFILGLFALWSTFGMLGPLLGLVSCAVGLVCAVKSAIAGGKAKNLLANNITRDILSEVFDECIYAAQFRIPDEMLRKSGLIANWDIATGSDLISAKYKGHIVNFSDIELSEEVEREDSDGDTSTSYVTKFKGQWMIFELGREVPAKLRLREKLERSGLVSKKVLGERYNDKSDVQTENTEFNERFQILTDDPQSAFYILTPHFMEFILSADNAADTRTYLCFFENQVHIACDTRKDSFELDKKDIANLDRLRARMKSELTYITSIADELLKNEYLFGRGEEAQDG